MTVMTKELVRWTLLVKVRFSTPAAVVNSLVVQEIEEHAHLTEVVEEEDSDEVWEIFSTSSNSPSRAGEEQKSLVCLSPISWTKREALFLKSFSGPQVS